MDIIKMFYVVLLLIMIGASAPSSYWVDNGDITYSLRQFWKEETISTDVLGFSVEKRPIWLASIGNPKAKRQLLLVCGQHGDEPDSTQACLYFLEHLARNRNKGNGLSSALNRYQIHIVPLLNPDGRAKKTRKNANNVNLNSNWGRYWEYGPADGIEKRYLKPAGNSYKGPSAFSEPETQALRAWVLKQRHLAAVIDYHTGVAGFSQGAVLFPFTAHAKNTLSPDTYIYIKGLAKSLASDLSLSKKNVEPVLAMQTQDMLPYLNKAIVRNIPAKYHQQALKQLPKSVQTPGSFIDWVYGERKIPAFALEMYFGSENVNAKGSDAFNRYYAELEPALDKTFKNLLILLQKSE